LVEINGLVVGGFSEVSGLEVEIDVEEYREGGKNEYVHYLPTGAKYPPPLSCDHALKRIWMISELAWSLLTRTS